VGVATEVIEYLNRPAEGRFGINDPFAFAVSLNEPAKVGRVGQIFKLVVKLQLSCLESVLEVGKEFSAKQARKDSNGKKESVAAWYPPGAVGGQSASGDDAMNMGMIQQILSPGV